MSLVRRRIIGSLAANAFGTFVTTLTQLFAIPVFLRYWDKPQFGEWLVISTGPVFLSLADAGFGTFGGNLLAKAGIQEAHRRYARLFSTIYFTSVAASLLIIGAAVLGIYTLPVYHWLHLHQISEPAARQSLAFLSVGAGCTMLYQLFFGLYRAVHRFARGTYLINSARLLQFFLTCLIVPFTKNISVLALAIACTQVVTTLLIQADLWSLNPLNRLRLDRFRAHIAGYIFRRSSSLLLFPLGSTLFFPTMSLAVNAVLGPVALVTFNALRTLTRTGTQCIVILHTAVAPEIAALLFTRNVSGAGKVYSRMMLWTLGALVPFIVFMVYGGPLLLWLWTKGGVESNTTQLLLFSLAAVLGGVWSAPSTLLRLLNQYHVIAWTYFGATLAALLSTGFFCRAFGVSGGAVSMILGDGLQLLAVLWVVQRLGLFHEERTDLPAAAAPCLE